jgi:hypothetical protein
VWIALLHAHKIIDASLYGQVEFNQGCLSLKLPVIDKSVVTYICPRQRTGTAGQWSVALVAMAQLMPPCGEGEYTHNNGWCRNIDHRWLDHFVLCLQWDKHKLQDSMCVQGYLTTWYICTLLMQFTKKLFSFCGKSWIYPEYIFFFRFVLLSRFDHISSSFF